MKTQICSQKTETACLDSVKFFGACIVAFIWHYQHFQPANGSPFGSVFAYSYQFGWLMVELFLMLSGFGMMVGYGSKILAHRISFPQYMGKRLGKIYPLFFVTLVLVTILEMICIEKTGITFVYPNFDLYHLFLNVTLLHDGIFVTDWSFNSPSWCISICFILYVVFFFVFYSSRKTKEAVAKFAGLGILGAVILISGWNYPVFNALVARGLLCFSIGVILAFLYQHEKLFNTKLVGYLCFIVLLGCYGLYRIKPPFVGDMHMLFILFICPMIILCTLFVPWLNKLLSLKVFTYLGSLSMQIYLFHFPVQCAIYNSDICWNLGLNYSSREVWILYFTATILVCILYKQLLEKFFTKLYNKMLGFLIRQDKLA